MVGKIGIDCEMVGDANNRSMLARVSLVDENGGKVYDSYCKPINPVGYYRTEMTDIREEHLRNAPSFTKVQADVRNLIRNKILIGHSVSVDLEMLGLSHPSTSIVDIAELSVYKDRNSQKRSLKDLAAEFLGIFIQQPYHDSLEDARAAMRLYKRTHLY